MKKIFATLLMFTMVFVVLPLAFATIPLQAHEHDYVAVMMPPTCTSEGYTTYTCSICGEWYYDDEFTALGHDYVAVVTPPTCTSEGYTTYTCSRCGEWYYDDEFAALGYACENVLKMFFGDLPWFSWF